ncbi:MAG: hypothetical protein AAF594_13760 [Bacteroidota bacterium]
MLAIAARPPSALQAALVAHEAAPASRTRAHLADYSFRFDTEAAEPYAVPRPQGEAPWTLAQTLQEIRIRGASVIETSGGLRLQHAHLLPELAAAIRRHELQVRLWFALGLDGAAPSNGWDDEVALHAGWLALRFDPGREAVPLRPGVAVTDWSRFVASVHDRLGAGPEAPCAPGLRRDLADLFSRHAVLDAPQPIGHQPARAA